MFPAVPIICRGPSQSCCALPRNLLPSHSSEEITLGDLKRVGGLQTCKQIERPRYDSGPSGLVAGPKPGAVVPVEILVEQNVVSPVRVFLKLLGSVIDGALAVRIAPKDARKPVGKYLEAVMRGGFRACPGRIHSFALA